MSRLHLGSAWNISCSIVEQKQDISTTDWKGSFLQPSSHTGGRRRPHPFSSRKPHRISSVHSCRYKHALKAVEGLNLPPDSREPHNGGGGWGHKNNAYHNQLHCTGHALALILTLGNHLPFEIPCGCSCTTLMF